MRSRAAIRYSKAIFQIATESKSLSMVKKDMDAIITAHKASSDFKNLLKNALISYADKKEIIANILLGMNDDTRNLIDLLIKNKRLSIMNDVAVGFNEIYNQKNNIAKATVVTAIPISEVVRSQVLNKIKTLSDKSVEIENIIDKTAGLFPVLCNTKYVT